MTSSPRDLAPDVVARARKGDEAARQRMLTALRPILMRFFAGRLGERADVDDLVQNTLLRIHTKLGDLHDDARLKGFAMKAALFELHDYYRGRYSAKESLLDPEAPLPGASEEPGVEMDVARALADLSPKARHILELRAYGYRYEEIAGMLESTEAAVKMQVKRALDRLRDLLVVLALLVLPLSSGPGQS